MTYNVFGGTLSLTQSINQPVLAYNSGDLVVIITIAVVKHCHPFSAPFDSHR